MKEYFKVLFLFFVPFIFVSCEADYEGVGDDTPDADPVVKSITLSISEASLAVGQEITFQVFILPRLGQWGLPVKGQSALTEAGPPLAGRAPALAKLKFEL